MSFLSNFSLSNIKFCSTDGNLLAWSKKEHIFLELDSLGIDCPVTTSYFTKIAPSLVHLASFHAHLVNQLMLVDFDATTVVKLVLHLKQVQLNAMLNDNDFIPILPEFEIYHTCLSHGHKPLQVLTDVLGIKAQPYGHSKFEIWSIWAHKFNFSTLMGCQKTKIGPILNLKSLCHQRLGQSLTASSSKVLLG